MFCKSGKTLSLNHTEICTLVERYLDTRAPKTVKRVLVLPPDISRLNSMAGTITQIIYKKLVSDGVSVDIMPTLGTHGAMSTGQIRLMYGDIPLDRFKVHDWQKDVVRVGQISASRLSELSGGRMEYPIDVEINRHLMDGYDMILSVGQVAPHEVVGMSNHSKNIVIGAGGGDFIHKSHFLGAVCGIEEVLGQIDTPVRRLLNEAVEFLSDLPIHYILTVVQSAGQDLHLRGFFAGMGNEIFTAACHLSREVNINVLEKEPQTIVVYLDPAEYSSTWIGNKAIYRTRMSIADGGHLIVLAPGLNKFGEDQCIDRLIQKYGYFGTAATLKAVENNSDLQGWLGVAAHLMHSASDGRFSITYCPGEGALSLDDIRAVGFYAKSYEEMSLVYNPSKLQDGWNTLDDGQEIFFISKPGMGLWASHARLYRNQPLQKQPPDLSNDESDNKT